MKNHLLLILTIVTFFNCNNDDDYTYINELDGNVFYEQKIDKYFFGYMHSGLNNYTFDPDETTGNVELIYEGNKIINRIGGPIQSFGAAGFFHKFSNNVYDELIYENNSITITRKENIDDYIIDPYIRKIILENNFVKQKITERNFGSSLDSITYTYDTNNKIIESLKKSYYNSTGPFIFSNSERAYYYYNTSNNLDSIIINKYNYNGQFEWPIVKKKFNNYDSSENPLKNLIIFNDTFNRSLSENNYSNFKEEEVFEDGHVNFSIKIWSFVYDDNGNIVY